jgi:hypothetical protein
MRPLRHVRRGDRSPRSATSSFLHPNPKTLLSLAAVNSEYSVDERIKPQRNNVDGCRFEITLSLAIMERPYKTRGSMSLMKATTQQYLPDDTSDPDPNRAAVVSQDLIGQHSCATSQQQHFRHNTLPFLNITPTKPTESNVFRRLQP